MFCFVFFLLFLQFWVFWNFFSNTEQSSFNINYKQKKKYCKVSCCLLFEVLKAQPRLTLCVLSRSSINELYWLPFAIFFKLFYLLWRNQSHKKCCLLCYSKNTTGLRIYVYVFPGSGISPGAYFGLLLVTHFFFCDLGQENWEETHRTQCRR